MAIRNVEADELQRLVAAGEPLLVDLVKDTHPWCDRQEPAQACFALQNIYRRLTLETDQIGTIIDNAIFCSAEYLRPLTITHWRQS